MRKHSKNGPGEAQSAYEAVSIPPGANFFDLYLLCFQHGKETVVKAMNWRLAHSLKTDHINWLLQRDAIFKINRMSIPEMVQACQNGPPEYHVSSIASQAWTWQEMLSDDNTADENAAGEEQNGKEHGFIEPDI